MRDFEIGSDPIPDNLKDGYPESGWFKTVFENSALRDSVSELAGKATHTQLRAMLEAARLNEPDREESD